MQEHAPLPPPRLEQLLRTGFAGPRAHGYQRHAFPDRPHSRNTGVLWKVHGLCWSLSVKKLLVVTVCLQVGFLQGSTIALAL